MKKINQDFFTNVKKAFRKKKVWIPTACACACAVTACAVYSNVRSVKGDDTGTSVQSATATTGTLTNSIEGTGTLEAGEGNSIKVPDGLTYEEVCVSAGDTVNAGDVLAKVSHESVLAKMEEIQSEISTIDSEMETARDDDSEETVTAGVSGTVTAVYVSVGDDVTSAMTGYGAIIQIAVGGDTEQIVSVTATEGTVASLSVAAGDTVDSGDTLCTLTLDGYSLEYQQLAEQRSTLVSELQTLIQIAQTDTITATESGTIASVGITAEDDSTTDSTTDGSASDSSGSTTTSASGTAGAVNASYSETSDSTAVFTDCVTYTQTSSEETEISFAITDDETGLYIAAPVTGEEPVTEIDNSDEGYTCTISWNPAADTFAADTQYTATVTLNAADGYCFTTDSLTSSDYTYEIVSCSGDELVLTLTFDATAASDSSDSSSDTSTSEDDTDTEDTSSGTTGSTSSGTTGSTSSGTTGSTISGSASGGTSGSASGGTTGKSGSSSTSASASAASDTTTSETTSTDSSDSSDSEDTGSDLVKAFTMMSSDTMSLEVSVDELDINDVAEDQSAEVTLDAIEDETFEGTVTDVDETAASSGSGSAKYTVTISIPKEDDMKVGMSASATIAVEESDENSILIPVNAIQEEGNTTYVYTSVDEDGNLSGKTEVTTGLSDGDQVVITEGLSEGDTVYYEKTGNVSSGSSDGMSQQNSGEMPDMSSGGQSGGSGQAPSGNMPQGGAPSGSTGN